MKEKTIKDIWQIYKRSTKTIWRDISELKEQGVLERIGDDFNG